MPVTLDELLEALKQAQLQAISSVMDRYCPQWLDPATIDYGDSELAREMMWIASCYEAISVKQAALLVTGRSNARAQDYIRKMLRVYALPRRQRGRHAPLHRATSYVLRRDAIALRDKREYRSRNNRKVG